MHHDFPADAPVAAPLFYRSYSRRLPDGTRESWEQVMDRNIRGLTLLGNLDQEQIDLLRRHQRNLTALPSGRWLWIGGTDWAKRPANFYGGYNCSSRQLNDISVFGALMDMAMQGTGTGAVLTCDNIAKLPTVKNHVTVRYDGTLGSSPPERRSDATMTTVTNGVVTIRVGDSRQGWVRAYQQLIDLAFDSLIADGKATVMIDLRWVRPAGETLKGFGGTANPAALGEMFSRVARTLNKAVGRRLTALECCLVIDEAARCVVAGNIRRSAGMRQFDRLDAEAATAKQGLWTQTEDGQWVIDPDKDALRMANHTRVFFCKPTFEEVLESVKSQHASGEGALMFAPEAIARANNDLLNAPWLKEQFLRSFEEGGQQGAMGFLCQILHGHADIDKLDDRDRLELEHRVNRYGLNPCGEIIGADFLCNLAEVHLNRLDPGDEEEIEGAFRAAALSVSILLHHVFRDPVMARSRHWDPIVGVSFTGLFDFFARAFGSEWLQWWADGRPPHFEGQRFRKDEEKYLRRWRQIVDSEVAAYCQGNGLRIPNRTTTVQPAGCLGEGAVRVFDQGLLTAADFAGGSGLAKALTKDLTVRRGIPIENWIANPEAPCLRVVLSSGREIVCTPDHRFMVSGSQRWVQARDLEIGSTLTASLGRYARTEETALYRVVGGPANQPDVLNDGLAYLLGYLTSNSGTGQPGVVSCVAPATAQGTRLLERLQRQLELNFGSHVSIKRKGKQLELTGQVHRIEEWMVAQLFPARSLERAWESIHELPLTVRRGSARSILHFLAGMIDATSRQIHRTRAHITLMNDALADHLLQIMEAVGLGVRIKTYASTKLLCIDPGCSRDLALEVINAASVLLQDRPLNRVATSWSSKGRAEDLFKVVNVLNTAKEHATYDVTVAINDDDAWYYTGGLVSHNSKSLLTNASPGWHPPKAPYYIRRVTFGKNDPIALACMDFGYSVVPSQSDKDEEGRLLDDPFDPRCTEWLVEIPVATPWADQPGAEGIQTDQFSALAQFDFYMGVQRAYTAHNTSATLTLTKEEIRPLARAIHAAIDTEQGYISAALLARSDCKETFPRMPYESISRQEYERLSREVIERRREGDFAEALRKRDAEAQDTSLEPAGPAGCDSDACTLPLKGQPIGDDPLDH